MSKTTVTCAELQRAFGVYRERALAEPVIITHHGRESLVLLSASEFQRLKTLERTALHPWELSGAEVEALEAAAVAEEAAAHDHEHSPDR